MKVRQTNYMDFTLIFVVLFLLAFGLVMLYSSSSYEAAVSNGDSAYYLVRQFVFVVAGLAVMAVIALIPYQFWKKFAGFGYLLSVALILLIIPFGVVRNGAKRWIAVGSAINIQPSEVAKLCIILFSGVLIERIGRNVRTWRGFLFPLVPAAIVAVMIWQITDNLSSAIIIMAIVISMLFVASPDYKRFIAIAGVAAAAAGVWLFITIRLADSGDLNFRSNRLLAWLHPEQYADTRAYQTIQALYAIGSGGVTGKGLGESLQKLGYVPEAQNDMIFSIICEELGLFGAGVVIFMFIILIWRFVMIILNARDLFGALLVVGVMAHISIQVILNIAVVTNTIPNTGVTLPFISYGGSAIMMQLVEIGLVLSVSRYSTGGRREIRPDEQSIRVGQE